MKKKKKINPAITGIITSLASGLLSNKKTRDAEKTKTGGTLRDVGITAVAAAGGSMALNANGIIDCSVYGLEPEFCNLAHGVLLLIGFAMYWIGISKNKKKENENE